MKRVLLGLGMVVLMGVAVAQDAFDLIASLGLGVALVFFVRDRRESRLYLGSTLTAHATHYDGNGTLGEMAVVPFELALVPLPSASFL